MKPQNATCVIVGSLCSIIGAIGLHQFTRVSSIHCAAVGAAGILGIALVVALPDKIRRR